MAKRRRVIRKKQRYRYDRMALVAVTILLVVVIVGALVTRVLDREPSVFSGQQVRVYNTETKALMELDLEEYLVGVVAAEMPASFDVEALKAQAVAARTFTISRMANPNPNVTAIHPQAQMTTSPLTCQAWIDEETQKQRWGGNYGHYRRKILRAVAETMGQVLTYEGRLIEPLYHASCGGAYTEAAQVVWGNHRPYLTVVYCGHGADRHSQQKTILSLAEFDRKLGAAPGTVPKLVASTASNRVQTVQLGERQISGRALRDALGLRSNLIAWQISGDIITVTTDGYGHGVGLCQYGANYHAGQRMGYREILALYYPGTALEARR